MTFATFLSWVLAVGVFAVGVSDVCGSSRAGCRPDETEPSSAAYWYRDTIRGLHDDGGVSLFRHDPRFRGEYTFAVEPTPRVGCGDPEVMGFFERGSPVILEGCAFAESALKWDLDFLKENMRDENHTTYISPNHKFLYYDIELMHGKFRDWKPPTHSDNVYFEEFLELVEQLKAADNGSHAYFQSPLILQEGVSSAMKGDVESFDYSWLLRLVDEMGWGEDVVNLLLVGMPNVVTPAHYDILENLFVQLYGRKRCILFSPEFYRSLYAFPVGHPHDRQTQVDFDRPDFHKFPRFREIRGLEAVVEPGDVLYIPTYWWHHIESEKSNMTISLNFWFEPKNDTSTDTQEPTRPQKESDADEAGNEKEREEEEAADLSPAGELALARNVELSLFKATRDHEKVGRILEAILAGRFNE